MHCKWPMWWKLLNNTLQKFLLTCITLVTKPNQYKNDYFNVIRQVQFNNILTSTILVIIHCFINSVRIVVNLLPLKPLLPSFLIQHYRRLVSHIPNFNIYIVVEIFDVDVDSEEIQLLSVKFQSCFFFTWNLHQHH